VYDTTIGWRFVNPKMKAKYGIDQMPETAENVAADFKVSRADQDAFALRSHKRAVKAIMEGKFTDEIVPLEVKRVWFEGGQRREGSTTFAIDEGPRRDTSAEALASLRPVFAVKGTVTAGNASQTSDGAAAVLVMSREKADALGLKPLARFVSFAVAGVPPDLMGIGPVAAVPKALQQAGLTIADIDLVELNEAFAAQALAVVRSLEIDEEKVNVNGGAIALGHPLGCSGAKLTVQILGELERRGGRYGLVTMCIGGGMGAAGIFERL
jgi:acetyl-CoA acyltransferase